MSDDARAELVRKLQAVRVSAKFTAILGFLLDETWTQPAITGLYITSDDTLLAGTTDDPFANRIEGTGAQLWRNLSGVADVAELTPGQRAALYSLARARVQSHRRSDA